jgi:two-component system CheB/CheR fusion protein
MKTILLVDDEELILTVAVVHLSPDHESHLAELLQPGLPFPVEQVTGTIPLESFT